MNFQTWQGSFEFDLIINPNLPSHKSNESELAWTCLGELRSKALSFPQKPFSFFARTGCCCNRASLLFTQPPFLVMKSLYSDSGGPPSAPVLSIQCAAQLIPALFYEWFMETRRTLRLSTFSLFQTVVQREWYFSCQWEPERPDGLFWQGSMSVKGRQAARGARGSTNVRLLWLPLGTTEKIFWLDFTVRFLVSTMRALGQWSEMPLLNLHRFPFSY